jgi:cytochrome c-type biogenesis protein
MTIKFFIAFAAGFISFLSPCVLPIIPGYISYITGKNLDEIDRDKKTVLTKTILFSLGFSAVFISLGIAASTIGNILLFLSNELRIVAGVIIIIFSLQLLGFLKLNFLNKEQKIETKSYKDNYIFPFIVGSAFAFGWTPCIGPVLGSIIALSATEATVAKGIILLSSYSLGLAIPFILSGYFMTKFLTSKKEFAKYYGKVTMTGGVVLLITGILILTNQIQVISYYILTTLPFLTSFG